MSTLLGMAVKVDRSGSASDVRSRHRQASYAPFVLGVLIVLAITAAYYLWVSSRDFALDSADDWARRGQFGDMFGALNALFSALAFALLIYTMHLQRKELGLQREELEETRRELSRAAAAQEQSQVALAGQLKQQAEALRLQALTAEIEKWDSEWMRALRLDAYRRFDRSAELDLAGSEAELLQFFEDLAVFRSRGLLDEQMIWERFSYFIEVHWAMYQGHVRRLQTRDSTWFRGFADLATAMPEIASRFGSPGAMYNPAGIDAFVASSIRTLEVGLGRRPA